MPTLPVLVLWLAAAMPSAPVEWLHENEPIWGIRNHLQFAIPPASHGPRGLIRILYPTLPDGRCELVNFIAIEPIVAGRRGFSELEYSRLDRLPGKRIRADTGPTYREEAGVRCLRVVLRIERFDSGAHVRLIIEQSADRPDEIALTIEAEPESAPLEYCILTATMGNKARARLLWLSDGPVCSRTLYPDYRGPDFAPHTIYPLERLPRTPDGDILAGFTTDEACPADVHPFPGSSHWYYGGDPVTQYWRTPKALARDDLHVAVNARYMYWRSHRPIPGGISFENVEMRERFHPGQQFIFGVTRKTPRDLGVAPASAPTQPRD